MNRGLDTSSGKYRVKRQKSMKMISHDIKQFYRNEPRYSIKDFKILKCGLCFAGFVGKGAWFHIYQVCIITIQLFVAISNFIFKDRSPEPFAWTVYSSFFIILAIYGMFYYSKSSHVRNVLNSKLIQNEMLKSGYQKFRKRIEIVYGCIIMPLMILWIVETYEIIQGREYKGTNVLTYLVPQGCFWWYLLVLITITCWFYTFIHAGIMITTFYLVMSIHRMEFKHLVSELENEDKFEELRSQFIEIKNSVNKSQRYYMIMVLFSMLMIMLRIILETIQYFQMKHMINLIWVFTLLIILFMMLFNISFLNDINSELIPKIYYCYSNIDDKIEHLCRIFETNKIQFKVIDVVITTKILGKLILFVVNIALGILLSIF